MERGRTGETLQYLGHQRRKNKPLHHPGKQPFIHSLPSVSTPLFIRSFICVFSQHIYLLRAYNVSDTKIVTKETKVIDHKASQCTDVLLIRVETILKDNLALSIII